MNCFSLNSSLLLFLLIITHSRWVEHDFALLHKEPIKNKFYIRSIHVSNNDIKNNEAIAMTVLRTEPGTCPLALQIVFSALYQSVRKTSRVRSLHRLLVLECFVQILCECQGYMYM